MKEKSIVIAGAGPAGLTAAYELLSRQSSDIYIYIYEESDEIGGISKTVKHGGNRIDIGGHRFFSKNSRVMDWWGKIMPMQGAPSLDEKLLRNDRIFDQKGPDPEKHDRVMLVRRRVSRIFYLRKFFDYPISLKFQTFKNMGFGRTMKAGFGYLRSSISKRKEKSLEDFYINRFGKPLYEMFFEGYTEKVWGLHPSKLGADWGSQRVKGLSIMAILKDVISKKFKKNRKNVETSLIEEFIYPKYGPGQLWETVAGDIQKAGGNLMMEHKVVAINLDSDRKVKSVNIELKDGSVIEQPCDYFISSMPIKDLVKALPKEVVPDNIAAIAEALPYRDFMTVGLLVDKLKITNKTKIATYQNRVPDTWIYIQERDVKIGRLQIFNNWSPYMVSDYENKMWIGLEYFCTEGDEMWTMKDEYFVKMAIDELEKIDILNPGSVEDSVVIRVKKAYPAYYGAYYDLPKVIDFLNTIPNLYCVGRNGQHRYNNMDHSMLTSMEAVDSILEGKYDKSAVWAVNTEEEYHETK